MKKEGEQGSIAKRWSRRTGRNVGGRIELVPTEVSLRIAER